MKSVFSIHGKLLAGLMLVLFSASALAQAEPTWVRDGVDWSQYSKFLVKPLNVDDVKLVRPPWAEDDPEEWELQIESLEAIQAIFRDQMKEGLSGNNGYPLVYAAGPGVLEVEVEILSIMPWIRPGSDGTKDGMQVTTMGTGELTASVELRDAKNRELLLLLEGEKSVGEEYKEFTTANNVANVENMFKSFALRLRTAMDKVHGK